MSRIPREKLGMIRSRYEGGASMQDIANEYDTSLDSVVYFFRKYRIPRRTAKENNAIIFAKKKPSFQMKEQLEPKDEYLKVAGVMLYWGEGSQWDGEKIVDFVNSNPSMALVFLKFLRGICGIDEKKLRAYIYCYDDQKPDALISFWSRCTKIPRRQFTKPYIRKDFRKEKSGKMKYGALHIRYADKKLLRLLKHLIGEYSTQWVGSEVVKRTTL